MFIFSKKENYMESVKWLMLKKIANTIIILVHQS